MLPRFDTKRRLTALYVRCSPKEFNCPSNEEQLHILMEYCIREQIPVYKAFFSACDEKESLQYLKQLARELPPNVRRFLALRFHRYSNNMSSLLSVSEEIHEETGVDLYSIELPAPIQRYNRNPAGDPED